MTRTAANVRKTTAPDRALVIRYRSVKDLVPYARNARTHSKAQVQQIAASIKEFGWTNPVLVDESGGIIAGHGRVLAAESLLMAKVPTIELRGLSEVQKRAYVIADNKLPENASWDLKTLAIELEALKVADFSVSLLGFGPAELRSIATKDKDGLTEADSIPEPPAVPISRLGDVWILGPHRVMCGDSTSAGDVKKLMGGNTASLLHADPPYGMGKEADGVLNDNLYAEKLDRFQMAWWTACRPHLEANASAYIWGTAPDLWRLWWAGGLANSEPVTIRNEIVWDKKCIPGMGAEQITQYSEASERCLFFQLGRYVFLVNQTKDDYWPGWEPIRSWLCAQRDLAGLTASRIKELVGNHMYGHWFGTSQWAFISAEHYATIANSPEAKAARAFARPFAELEAEYRETYRVYRGEVRDPRSQAFRAARPYFDNVHDVMYDVWEFPRVTGAERHGHATPKPVAMMERVMRSSARPGEIVLEPFGGSGSTLMGCERTGRSCYAMEMQPQYVDVIVKRWEAHTGKKARLEGEEKTKALASRRRGKARRPTEQQPSLSSRGTRKGAAQTSKATA